MVSKPPGMAQCTVHNRHELASVLARFYYFCCQLAAFAKQVHKHGSTLRPFLPRGAVTCFHRHFLSGAGRVWKSASLFSRCSTPNSLNASLLLKEYTRRGILVVTEQPVKVCATNILGSNPPPQSQSLDLFASLHMPLNARV